MNTTSTPVRSRYWRILALLLAFGLVAAACGNDSDTGADPDGPDDPDTTEDAAPGPEDVTRGGSVSVGLEDEQANWLPGAATFSNPGVAAAVAVYDPIAARAEDGQVYPFLAESIEPNDELTEWTVTLREGVQFHDGTDLTAEVMKTIFDEYLAIEEATGLPAMVNRVEEVRVDDELTYTYVLDSAIAPFPDALVGPMGWAFSVEACEAAGGRDGDCGEQMVGTGPFVFESWIRDGELTLSRNPDYWRVDANGEQLPYLDELVFQPIPDEDARLNSVASGTIDVGQTLRQSSVRAARELDDVATYESIGNNGGGSIFNTAMAPTDDLRVRRALAYAVDQEDLVEVLGGTDITPPQTQFFSPDSPWYSADVADAWPSDDPEQAEEHLAEYVNDPDRSDGRAVGDPVEIDFYCPPDPTLVDLAQAYQGFWQAVGFEVNLIALDQPTHIQNAIAGDYMINCWRAGGQEDPFITLSSAFGDPETTPVNFTNYSSESIDENLEILRTSTDFDVRYAAVEDIMFELADQVPQIWTAGTATSLFADDSVHGIADWTIPGPDGAPLVEGNGALNATVFWAEVWIEQ
ncbi:MAG: ABC transporter substrate-binding protein [Acidimicrobiales bacterium]|nr:ABC transporter substrate-binding protein [Acidimicrobiales bacterium]